MCAIDKLFPAIREERNLEKREILKQALEELVEDKIILHKLKSEVERLQPFEHIAEELTYA